MLLSNFLSLQFHYNIGTVWHWRLKAIGLFVTRGIRISWLANTQGMSLHWFPSRTLYIPFLDKNVFYYNTPYQDMRGTLTREGLRCEPRFSPAAFEFGRTTVSDDVQCVYVIRSFGYYNQILCQIKWLEPWQNVKTTDKDSLFTERNVSTRSVVVQRTENVARGTAYHSDLTQTRTRLQVIFYNTLTDCQGR